MKHFTTKGIRLSFCIPTFNFGEFIGETLESIIAQATEDVEIVVVDGASTDNTEQIVREFQRCFPRLRYFRRERNMGIDRDLARAVELAQGDYCWLLSSDDVLKSGAVQRMLDEIKLGHAVYMCNRTEFEGRLNPIKHKLSLSKHVLDRVFDLSMKQELVDYLKSSKTIGALFSYISSIVVSREAWDGVAMEERFIGTAYAHVYKMLAIVLGGGQLKYLREPLVWCRTGNDSFLSRGAVGRVMLDIDGYLMFADRFFGDSPEIRAEFLKVMVREHPWYLLIKLKSLVPNDQAWNHIAGKLCDVGYSSATLWLSQFLGGLRFVTPLLLLIKRTLNRHKRKCQQWLRRSKRRTDAISKC